MFYYNTLIEDKFTIPILINDDTNLNHISKLIENVFGYYYTIESLEIKLLLIGFSYIGRTN